MVRAALEWTPVVKTEVQLLYLPTEHDPMGRAVAQVIKRFDREVWQVYHDQGNTKEHFNLQEPVQTIDEANGTRVKERPFATIRWF